MQRSRNKVALAYVLRSRNYLHQLVLANIDLTNLQFICVGMLFQLDNFSEHNVFHTVARFDNFFDFKTCSDKFVGKFFYRHVYIYKVF